MVWEQISARCAWAELAPKVETAHVTFDVPDGKRLLQVRLRVFDNNGLMIHEGPAIDCRRGLPMALDWDGSRNRGVPPAPPVRYVHPGLSPLRLEVHADTEVVPPTRSFGRVVADALAAASELICGCGRPQVDDEEDQRRLLHAPPPPPRSPLIAVRYHGIELRRVPWAELYPLDDKDHYPGAEDEPTRIKWLQYRLNALGYFAGPVTGARSNELTRAVMRYRHHHGKELYSRLFDYFPHEDDRTDDRAGALAELAEHPCDANPVDAFAVLVSALEASSHAVTVLSEPTVFEDDHARSTLYVDDNVFYTKGYDCSGPPDLATIHTNRDSGAFVKHDREQVWLTPPHVPLEAKVLLARHDGSAVHVPEAVGPVEIEWDWESSPDHPPLPSPQAGKPSTVAGYVGEALSVLNHGADAKYQHNAPQSVGGQVSADATQTRAAAFVAHPNVAYDAVQSRTSVVTDVTGPGEAPQGTTRIYLQTSTFAGDSYRVSARLVLDEPEMAIADAQLERHSGMLRIWRRTRVSSHVQWPTRALPIPDTAWRRVEQIFAHAFVEIDTTAMQRVVMSDAIIHDHPGPCGPDAHQKSYYYSAEPRRAFSPDATFPNEPVMCTPAGAADALLATSVVRRECADWKGTTSMDGKRASADIMHSLAIARALRSTAGVAARAGVSYTNQLEDRLESDPLQWKAIPATTDRANLALLDDGSVPPDPVVALEDAINALVKGPIDAILGLAHRSDGHRDLMISMGHVLAVGWDRTPDPILRHAAAHFRAQLDRVIVTTTQTISVRKGPFTTNKRVTVHAFADPLPASIDAYVLDGTLVKNAIWGTVSGHCEKIGNTVNLDLQRYVRAERGWGDGLIFLDAKPHPKVTSVRGEFTYPGLNCGQNGGMFMVSQFSRNEISHLLSHEMAHCMFLRHYKNAGNHQPLEHDTADDNCVMSYGFNLGAIAVEAEWSDGQRCYVLTVSFTDNEGVPAKFDRLVEFTSSHGQLWFATTRIETDADGIRKHQGSIKVMSEGYVAKARLYVPVAPGDITVTATALADTTASVVIGNPRTGADADGAWNVLAAPTEPVSQLGGYGSGAHYHVPDGYQPEFCGKCNLVLRGWRLDADTWPARAP